MARARIVLRGCETFTPLSGEAWRKGQSRTITNEAQIRYYKGQAEFTVTELAESKSKSKPKLDGGGAGGEGDDGGDGEKIYTEALLDRLNKGQLVDLAAERWGLALDEDEMKKDDLIAAILTAQG